MHSHYQRWLYMLTHGHFSSSHVAVDWVQASSKHILNWWCRTQYRLLRLSHSILTHSVWAVWAVHQSSSSGVLWLHQANVHMSLRTVYSFYVLRLSSSNCAARGKGWLGRLPFYPVLYTSGGWNIIVFCRPPPLPSTSFPSAEHTHSLSLSDSDSDTPATPSTTTQHYTEPRPHSYTVVSSGH